MKNKIILLLFILPFAFLLFTPNAHAEEVDYSVVNTDNSSKTYQTNIPDAWYDFDNKCGAHVVDGAVGGSSSDISMAFVDLIDSKGQINYAIDNVINLSYNEEITFYMEAGFLNWGEGAPYTKYHFSYVLDDLEISVSQKYGDTLRENLFYNGSFESVDSLADGFDYDFVRPVLYNDGTKEVTQNMDYHLFGVTIKALSNTSVSCLQISVGDGKSGGCSTSVDLVINVVEDKNSLDYDSFTFFTDASSAVNYSTKLSNGLIAFPLKEAKILNMSYSNEILKNTVEYNGEYFDNIIKTTLSFSGNDPNYRIIGSKISFNKAGTYKINCTQTFEFSYVYAYGIDTITYEQKTIEVSRNIEIEFFIYDDTMFTLENNGKEIANGTNYLDDEALYVTASNEKEDLSFRILVDGNYASTDSSVSFFDGTLSLGQHTLAAEIYNKYTKTSITTNAIVVNVSTEEDLYPDIVFSSGNSGTFVFDELDSDHVITVTNILRYNQMIASGEVEAYVDSGDASVEIEDGTIYLYGAAIGNIVITVEVKYINNTRKTATFTVKLITTNSDYTFSKVELKLDLQDDQTENIEFGVKENGIFNKILIDGYSFSYNIPNNIVKIEQDALDKGILIIETNEIEGSEVCNILLFKDEVFLKVINILIEVTDESKKVTETTFNFSEGTKVNMLLSNNEGLILHIDPLVSTMNLQFLWYSLNSRVATVTKIDQTSAKVIAKGKGETQIVAIYSDSYGSTVTGTINVSVLESIPTIGITVSKESDSSSFTVYDELSISLNKNDFKFSSSTKYEWYLDDEKISLCLDSQGQTEAISNSTTSFYLKMTEGVHAIKVVLTDSVNELVIEAQQEVNITTVINQERIIGVDCANEIFLALDGERFKINALLDGVVNLDYVYSFGIDDSSVASIYMTSNNSVLIEAVGYGTTTLNVFTNIGKYENKIIRKEIKIIVEKIEKFEIKVEKEFYKPNSEVKFSVLVNGKKGFVNFTPKVDILCNGEVLTFSQEGDSFTVADVPSGKIQIEASYRDFNDISKIDVTSFNVKQFILTILPYLCACAVLAILIYSIIKINGNPYRNVEKAVNKLKGVANKNIDIKNYKSVRRIYHRIERRTASLLNKTVYYYDEGIDEYKHAIVQIESLKKVMLALLKTVNENTVLDKVPAILDNLNKKQIANISDIINEIILSRKRYNDVVKNTMAKDNIKTIKENKKKMTKEEYAQYLIEIGVVIDERTNDGD